MSQQFKPGDLVECVDATPYESANGSFWHDGEEPVEGAIYTVSTVGISWDAPAVKLAERSRCDACVARGKDHYGAFRFRLYRSPNIEALLRDCSDPVYGDNSQDGASPKKRERA